MTGIPVANAELVQCLQASVASVDPALDDIAINRTFPVIICADVMGADGEPDYSTAMELADQARAEIKDLLEASDCELIGEFGPFDGSRLWSLFYRTKKAEKRADAAKREKEISNSLKSRLVQAARGGGHVAKIATAVGAIVVVATTGSLVAATLGIPAVAYVLIMSAGPTVAIVESTKKLFGFG